MMRHGFALAAVCIVVAAACGGEQAAPTTMATPTTSPTTTTTTQTPSTVTAPSDVDEVATPTMASELDVSEAVIMGAPSRMLMPAQQPSEIDWTAVGLGWLVIDHPVGHGGPFTEPTTFDQRGLYLVSPDDVAFGVSALPSDGSWIADVSEGGRHVLLEIYDPVCADGCTCTNTPAIGSSEEQDDRDLQQRQFGYAVLDSETTALRSVIDPVVSSVCDPPAFDREVRFTANGEAMWVSEAWWGEDWRELTRVRLSRVDLDDLRWSTVLDESVDIDLSAQFVDRTDHGRASVIELDDGRLVTESTVGVWLREPNGEPILEIDAPATQCRLIRQWHDGSNGQQVLAQCSVPDEAERGCWATGLWLLDADGGSMEPLVLPEDDDGGAACFWGYVDVYRINDTLAVQASSGDGSCPEWVEIIDDAGPMRWHPAQSDVADPCDEHLLGIRDGAWVVHVSSETGEGGVFEVARDGNSSMLALPSGEVIVL